MRNTIFVGREKQLKELNQLFEETKSGLGKVVLLSGDAGSGKSSLVRKFVQEAETKHNVVSAIAECSDKEGINAYSPFKDILISLNINSGKDTTENKKKTFTKLKGFFSEAGKDWLGMIPVIGSVLAAGVGTVQAYNSNFKNDSEESPISSEGDIHRIFEAEFRRLAEKHPIIVVLDDLQWADASSLNLLFMLSKSIRQNPFNILLIGTYRPTDVNAGRNKIMETGINTNIRHPLADKINELRNYTKREAHIQRTDKWLNEINVPSLNLLEVSNLINELFKNNKFPKDFNQKLLDITKGHALFVNEILDTLVEQETIYLDGKNIYQLKDIHLTELPTSINGVIGERVQRLDKELKKVLDYASVSGEDFKVQVLEQILKIDELDLLDYIEDLCKKHGLLVSSEAEQIQDTLFDLYHFTNKLVHKYVYENLEGARRRALHRRVAQVIKSIFGDELETNNELNNKYQHHLQIGKGLIDGITLELTQSNKIDDNELDEIMEAAQAEATAAKQSFDEFAIAECIAHADKALAFLSNANENNSEITQIKFNALRWRNKAQSWTGLYKDAFATAEKMLAIAEKQQKEENSSIAYNRLGSEARFLGDFDDSINYLQKSLKISKELNDKESIAENLNNIGRAYSSKGLYDIAIENFKEAVVINDGIENYENLAENYLHISSAHSHKSEYDKGIYFLEIAHSIAKEHSNKQAIANIFNRKGLLISWKGKHEQAISYFEQAIEIDKSINDRINMANHYSNIGLMKENMGEYDSAIEFYKKVLAVDESLDDLVKMAMSYINIGDVHSLQGDYKTAFEYFEKARKIYLEMDNEMGLSTTYTSMANSHFRNKDNKKAYKYYLKGLEIDKKTGNKTAIASFYVNVGNIKQEEGEYQEAFENIQTGLKVYKELNDKLSMATCLNNLGNIRYMEDKEEDALSFYKQALEMNQETNNKLAISMNFNNIAVVLDELNQYDEAISYYQKAIDIDAELDDKVQLATHLNNIARSYKKKGDFEPALENFEKSLALNVTLENAANIAKNYTGIADVYSEVITYSDDEEAKNNIHILALDNYNKAMEIYAKAEDVDNILTNVESVADLYKSVGKHSEAIENYLQLTKDYTSLGNKNEAATHYNSIGICYFIIEENKNALVYFNKAIDYCDGENSNMGLYYANLALVHSDLHKYKKTIKFSKKALEISKEHNLPDRAAEMCQQIAESYLEIDKANEAVNYFQEAVNFYKTDGDMQNTVIMLAELGKLHRKNDLLTEAFSFYSQAAVLCDSYELIDEAIDSYSEMASIRYLEERYSEALEYYTSAYKYNIQQNQAGKLASNNYNLGLCKVSLKNHEEAIVFFKQALENYIQLDETQDEIADSHYQIGICYYHLGKKKKALKKLNKVKQLRLDAELELGSIEKDIEFILGE